MANEENNNAQNNGEIQSENYDPNFFKTLMEKIKPQYLIILLILSIICNGMLYGAYSNLKTSTNNEISELTQKYDEANKNLNNLKISYETLESRVSEKESEITSLKGQITSKDNEIKALNDKVVQLEAEKAQATTTTNITPTTVSSSSPNNSVAANNSDDYSSSTVYITKTGEKYHESWCSSLRKSKIAISLSDAKARGYTACKICH